jgi:polysaccharide export outer membrane protein
MMKSIMRSSARQLACVAVGVGLAAATTALQAQTKPVPVSAAAAIAAAQQYQLAAGDTVRITVFQNPDLSFEARLNENGVISYPLLGAVALGGKTVTQAEKQIADALRTGNFVKQPQVNILVTQVRGHVVSVLGQVGKPGRYPLENAEVHLSELLAEAGGIASGGSDIVVVAGTRDGKPYRVEIDAPAIFGTAHVTQDVVLQNGDSVWIDRAPVIYIYGEIQRPGTLRLERNMSVLQVLAASGGITQRGTVKGLRVHRRDAQGKVEVLQPNMDDMLKPDDVVYIRESLF